MIAKLIIASLLAATSTASAGQDVAPSARVFAAWPHMHAYKCTLEAAGKLAIKTKGTSAGRSPVAGDVDGDGWRIDLQLAESPDGSGGPMISAYAINTKGTGTSSGRMSSDFAINTKGTGTSSGRVGVVNQNPIGVECVKSEVTGDETAQKTAAAAFMSADGKGVGWSCSVSGSEDKPVFRVSLLVPTILGQGETPVGKSSWSWGVSNSRVSIVPRSAENSEGWHVACSSKEPRKTNYDLAVLKKI